MKKSYLGILVIFLVLLFMRSEKVSAGNEGVTEQCNNPENAIIYMTDAAGQKALNMRCDGSGVNLYYIIDNQLEATIAQSFIAIGTAAKYAKKPFSISHQGSVITRVRVN